MTWLVDALAVYRITRLVTTDTITAPARDGIIRTAFLVRDGADHVEDWEDETPFESWTDRARDTDGSPKLAEFVTCPWCVSVWVAAGVVLARRFTPRAWRPAADVLALAAVAGWAASHE